MRAGDYHFVKLSTDAGIIGWSEFDEGFGSPGVAAAIGRLATKVVGQPVSAHERIYAELYCATRPAAGGIVAQAMGAIENALIDAKAKALGVPCYELLGGKIRDRIPVYWSHCPGGASTIRHITSRRSSTSTGSRRLAASCARRASSRSRPTFSFMRMAGRGAGDRALAHRSIRS